MQYPIHPLYASVVRIRATDGRIAGAGFLAAPGLICTCAHVVAVALEIEQDTATQPTIEVCLDFPFFGEFVAKASVKVWVPAEPNNVGGDLAVLSLTSDPPAGARPARLLSANNLSGKDFIAYGFPSTTDVGQYAYGIMRDRLANGWIQLEGKTTQGYRIQQGYSGTPVWDQERLGVVGIVVAEDRNPEAKVAFLIPNYLLLHACPNLKPVTNVNMKDLEGSYRDLAVALHENDLKKVDQLRDFIMEVELDKDPQKFDQEILDARVAVDGLITLVRKQYSSEKDLEEAKQSTDRLVKLGNNWFINTPLNEIPGIVALVMMVKQAPPPELRIYGIQALLKLRRPANKESEKTLKTILTIATKDKDKRVKEASKLGLLELKGL